MKRGRMILAAFLAAVLMLVGAGAAAGSAAAAGGPVITTASLPDATVGQSYGAALQAGGGDPPYTWAAKGLPAGLALDPSTGLIYGAPAAAGSYQVQVTVTDMLGATGQATLSLTVLASGQSGAQPASPAILTTSLPDAFDSWPYNAQIQVSCGYPPCGLSAAGLPNGLSAYSFGIQGTPNDKPGTYHVTLTITDSTGASASKTLSLTLSPWLAIATISLPDATVGQPYQATLQAVYGTPPYTWQADPLQPLPAGLALDAATGAISGVPTTAGTYQAQVSVTDSVGHSTGATLGLTVLPAPGGSPSSGSGSAGSGSVSSSTPPAAPAANPLVALPYLPTGVIGQPYSAQLLAVQGTPPYTWEASGLPAGLSLSGDAISGVPEQAGLYKVTVTATDAGGRQAAQTVGLEVIEPQTRTVVEKVPENPPQTGAIVAKDGGVTVQAPGQTATVSSAPVQAGTPVGDWLQAASNVYTFAGALTDADITFAYDPEVFYPAVPTGMLPDRLGIYGFAGGKWQYVGGKVDTAAHTVSIAGLNVTDFPQGTGFAVLAMTTRFSDVPPAAHAAWFTQPVDAAIGHHVLAGYPDGTFRLAAPVTRAEFAAMLARALRLDALGAAAQRTFSDVPASAWEFGAVEAAAQAGLVNGYPDGSFKPDRSITREELTAMVARALDYAKSHKGLWTKAMKVPDLTPPAWADAAQVDAWARDAVAAAARAGIVLGYPDGSFRPLADATRAETAAMVARLIADLGV